MAQLDGDIAEFPIDTLSDYMDAKTQSRSTVALQNCDMYGNCNPLKTEMKVRIKVCFATDLDFEYEARL